MKSAILLFLLFISGCAQIYDTNSKYTGTWLLTLSENGRKEKLSIYPDNTAVYGGREFVTYKWFVKNGKIGISYVDGSKEELISQATISKDEQTLTSVRFAGDTMYSRFTANKLSVSPNENISLFEICYSKEKPLIWQCMNVGSGETCYGNVPWEETTSTNVEECKAQCVSFLNARREGEYKEHAKLESCASE